MRGISLVGLCITGRRLEVWGGGRDLWFVRFRIALALGVTRPGTRLGLRCMGLALSLCVPPDPSPPPTFGVSVVRVLLAQCNNFRSGLTSLYTCHVVPRTYSAFMAMPSRTVLPLPCLSTAMLCYCRWFSDCRVGGHECKLTSLSADVGNGALDHACEE